MKSCVCPEGRIRTVCSSQTRLKRFCLPFNFAMKSRLSSQKNDGGAALEADRDSRAVRENIPTINDNGWGGFWECKAGQIRRWQLPGNRAARTVIIGLS